MKFVALVVFAFAAVLQTQDVASWSFLPIDEPVESKSEGAGVVSTTFVCQADVPLTNCQVMADVVSFAAVLPVDLSRGSSSGVVSRSDIFSHFDITYNGTGLEHGQCGATFTHGTPKFMGLSIDVHQRNLYACRGADAAGEWHSMDFMGSGTPDEDLPATISPRQVVLMPGDNVTVMLSATPDLSQCFIVIVSTVLSRRAFKDACSTTLKNVTEIDNGYLQITGSESQGNLLATRRSTVIVASPPTETYFNVDKSKYSVGDTLKATCSSLLSRPVANLTWTLDDRIIRQDGIDNEFQEDVWSWPWNNKNITQRMSIKLEEEHFGKKLECSVQHLALTNQQSDFHYMITKV